MSFLERDQEMRVNHLLLSGTNRFSSKLAPKYVGPFTIQKVLAPTTYLLDTGSCRKNNKVHVSQLKRLIPRRDKVDVVYGISCRMSVRLERQDEEESQYSICLR